MSDDNKQGEGSKPDGERSTVDVSEVLKRIEQLESTNNRLLDQSKKWKDQAADFKSKFDEAERLKVESSGDAKAQVDYERKQREKVLEDYKKLREKTLDQSIRSAVTKYAKDAHNHDDIINRREFRDSVKTGIDPENMTVNEDVIKDAVNLVLEKYPYLNKNTQQVGVDSTKPNYKSVSNKSDFSGKSSAEIMQIAKQTFGN